VFVALGIQHAMRLSHSVICGMSGCAIFTTLSQNGTIFGVGGTVIEHKMRVLILSTTFV
jgi:hypothetical protein